MVTIEKIKNKVSAAIKNSGMTQSAIAQKIGVCQQAVSHYLKGEKLPALDTLAKLCDLLDLDANDILCIHEYADKY
ncbi:MAG: helix-turn-helix transcriptional regulator [Clostridiales bacterium]|nr:helix-turn-helix transcriptional regulator [Clostridiales bacterium]